MTEQNAVVELQGLKKDMCRLCLATNVNLALIFSHSNKLGCTIANAVMECTTVQISLDDPMSLYVCEDCYRKVRYFWKFKKTVLHSDAMLKRYLKQLCVDDHILRRHSIKDDTSDIDVSRYTDKSSDDEIMTRDTRFDPDDDITPILELTDEIVDETPEIEDEIEQTQTEINKCQNVNFGVESINKRAFISIPITEKMLTDKLSVQDSLTVNETESSNALEKINSCQENYNSSPAEKITSVTSDTERLKAQNEESFEIAKYVVNGKTLRKRKRQNIDVVSKDASSYDGSDDDWEIEKDLTPESTDGSSGSETEESMISEDNNLKNKHISEEDEQTNLKCTSCSKTFSRKDNLRRHIAEKHRSDDFETSNELEKINSCQENENISPAKKTAFVTSDTDSLKAQNEESFETTNIVNAKIVRKRKRQNTDVASQDAPSDVSVFNDSDDDWELEKDLTSESIDGSSGSKTEESMTSEDNNLENKRVSEEYEQTNLKCILCNKTFSRKDSLRRHIVEKHQPDDVFENENRFKCDLCQTTFTCKRTLRKHNLDKHESENKNKSRIKCKICNETFSRQDGLRRHILRCHHSEDCKDALNYKCSICNEKFNGYSNLYTHEVRHFDKNYKPGQLIKCNICGKLCKKLKILKTHLVIHNDDRPFECPKCDKKCKRKDDLNSHLRRVHDDGCKPESVCPTCGKMVKFDMEKHLRKCNSTESAVVCNKCGKLIKRRCDLRVHMQQHDGEMIKCPICKKSYKGKALFNAHKRNVHHKGEFKCKICFKIFHSRIGFTVHVKNVHGRKRTFNCKECKKTFTTYAGLKFHEQSAHSVNQFECNECGKSFSRKSYLFMHQRMHSGEKPYKCNECDKRFSRNDNLKMHLKKVHSKSMKYKCKVCDRQFEMRHRLDNHIEKKHNVPMERD